MSYFFQNLIKKSLIFLILKNTYDLYNLYCISCSVKDVVRLSSRGNHWLHVKHALMRWPFNPHKSCPKNETPAHSICLLINCFKPFQQYKSWEIISKQKNSFRKVAKGSLLSYSLHQKTILCIMQFAKLISVPFWHIWIIAPNVSLKKWK